MRVVLKHHTPLKVCSDAIRTCWQSFDKSDDGGEADLALIDRVGNKFKHSSTLEHLQMIWFFEEVNNLETKELIQLFEKNPFSYVTEKKDSHYIVSSNVRALQQLDLPSDTLSLLLPNEYSYLFRGI